MFATSTTRNINSILFITHKHKCQYELTQIKCYRRGNILQELMNRHDECCRQRIYCSILTSRILTHRMLQFQREATEGVDPWLY
jgi:hypothetical protein